jgi:orotate phosphoribosyltransferase-like protein
MTELSAHKQTSAKIRELFNDGKTKQEIQDELKISRRTVNSATWYMIKKEKDALKPKQETPVKVAYPETIYSERDARMREFYSSLNTKGALSKLHMHDMGNNNQNGESA